ncbi:MAG TPA: Lrp/AsnC family transcriptional regulator [Solirubrobacterales bacterium]|jgi:Lrp/AsnC family leucine-responsive transcriptional regulator|nr:Lrp/AsnC family transcriptional regulator [Solirubrobacterales bacterium]
MPSGPPDLDGTDLEIIELLRLDARRTLADIGARVGLSAPAAKRRVARLERLGVIVGYRVEVDHAKLGRPIEAFTELRFAGETRVADIRGLAAGLPEVEAIYTTAGDPDAIAHLRVRDVGDLTRVIDLLRRSGRVTGTKTMMVLDAQAAERAARGRPQPASIATGSSSSAGSKPRIRP